MQGREEKGNLHVELMASIAERGFMIKHDGCGIATQKHSKGTELRMQDAEERYLQQKRIILAESVYLYHEGFVEDRVHGALSNACAASFLTIEAKHHKRITTPSLRKAHWENRHIKQDQPSRLQEGVAVN